MEHWEIVAWLTVVGIICLDYYQTRKQKKEEQARLDEIYSRMFKPRHNIPMGKVTWNIQCACEGEFRNLCMIHGADGTEAYKLLPHK